MLNFFFHIDYYEVVKPQVVCVEKGLTFLVGRKTVTMVMAIARS